jgi:hypothetical protein
MSKFGGVQFVSMMDVRSEGKLVPGRHRDGRSIPRKSPMRVGLTIYSQAGKGIVGPWRSLAASYSLTVLGEEKFFENRKAE